MTGGNQANLAPSRHPALHLTRRFLGALRPGPPVVADEAWARSQLGRGELAIWLQMSNPDRRHAIGVARAVAAALGGHGDRAVMAAALLHDSGKTISELGTAARVVATLVWLVLGTGRARRWAAGAGPFTRRLGQYHLHPELGARLLEGAGADPLTIAWTREHHLLPDQWTIPYELAAVLKACDDD